MGVDADEQGGQRAEKTNAGCVAVKTVDEVDGIGAEDEPDSADEDADQRMREHGTGCAEGETFRSELVAEDAGHGATADLPGEFLQRRKRKEIIQQADEEDQTGRG